MANLGQVPMPSASWDADDERASDDSDDDRPIVSMKRRMGRRDPIIVGGPSSTLSGPRSTRTRPAGLVSSSSPPASVAPSSARPALPFEFGTEDDEESEEVDRVTLRRKAVEKPTSTATAAGLTVEAFLASGTIEASLARRRSRKAKGKSAAASQGATARRQAPKSKKSMNLGHHSQPLAPGRSRSRRVRQPSGLETPLRALQLFSPPSSPDAMFNDRPSTRRRKSFAGTTAGDRLTSLGPSPTAAQATRPRPDFTQFPRFPSPALRAVSPASSSLTTAGGEHRNSTRKPTTAVRAVSEWGWGVDVRPTAASPQDDGSGSSSAREVEQVAKILFDVDMLDGRLPGRRAKGARPVRGAHDDRWAKRHGLPELRMVEREEASEGEGERACADDTAPARQTSPRTLFHRAPAVPALPPAATPATRPRVPRPRLFDLASVRHDVESGSLRADLSESVVDRSTTSWAVTAERLSTVVDEQSDRTAQHAIILPSRTPPPPLPPPGEISEIVDASTAPHSQGARSRLGSRGPTSTPSASRPLSHLVETLLSAPHTAVVRNRSGGSSVAGIALERPRRTEPLTTTEPIESRSWGGSVRAREAERSETVNESSMSVEVRRNTPSRSTIISWPTVEDLSGARAGRQPLPSKDNAATANIELPSSMPTAGARSPPEREVEVLVFESSTPDPFAGGISFQPVNEDDVAPDVPMRDAAADQSLDQRPLRSAQSSDNTVNAQPLVLALSSDESSALHKDPPRASPTPSVHTWPLALGQDQGWQHLTLSQASGADSQPPSDPIGRDDVILGAVGPSVGTTSTTQTATSTSAFTYELESVADVNAPPLAAAAAATGAALNRPFGMVEPPEWPFRDGNVGLTDMLEYERLMFASRETADDMDLDFADLGTSVDDIEGDEDRTMAEPSPPTSEDGFEPPSPAPSLPTLHFLSSASPAPSTPSPKLTSAPPPPPKTRTKGILRSSSPLTEVDSDAPGRSVRRSKTVTFASEGAESLERGGNERYSAPPAFGDRALRPSDSRSNGAQMLRPTRAPPSEAAGSTASSSSAITRPGACASPPVIPSYQRRPGPPPAASSAPSHVQATFVSPTLASVARASSAAPVNEPPAPAEEDEADEAGNRPAIDDYFRFALAPPPASSSSSASTTLALRARGLALDSGPAPTL